MDILRWDEVINQFVNKFHRLSGEKKDDLRQEFYLALLQASPPPQTRDEVASILHKILDKTRRRDVLTKRRTADFEELFTTGVKPTQEKATLLKELLGLISIEQRDIIEQIFFGGLTEKEIGAVLGKSRYWVSRQKTKGIKAIKSILRGRDAHRNKTNNLD